MFDLNRKQTGYRDAFPPSVSKTQPGRRAGGRRQTTSPDELTPREVEILTLLARGATNKHPDDTTLQFDDLAQIPAPTLVMAADDDLVSLAHLEANARYLSPSEHHRGDGKGNQVRDSGGDRAPLEKQRIQHCTRRYDQRRLDDES